MRKVIKLSEIDIKSIVKKVLQEQDNDRYMFFSNIEQIRRQCDILLKMDEIEVKEILENGHDWAQDHIAEAKSLLDQVFDFLMNQTNGSDGEMDESLLSEEYQIDESKNKPTNPKLWAQSLAWARSKYDVCPSAYCNGAAAKRYKSKGGGWRKEK